eukprot:COSAG03_NODE_13963_length_482_cov_0.731070_1_plen_110_part_01
MQHLCTDSSPTLSIATCPPVAMGCHCSIWCGDGTPATFEELVASAVESDVVLIGEEHDDRVTHALQLDLLSALNSRLSNTRQLALAMEMFETDVQPIIDDYLDGHIREKD